VPKLGVGSWPSSRTLDHYGRRSSLLQTAINYEHKKFYNSNTRAQCYKTFYGRNLLIFVISYSVCSWQDFSPWSNKHSSLVQKLINYGQE
jgi:hypothetical protein